MFCENCGKQLIRGYQFCLECGTPVPPEHAEEQPAAAPVSEENGMPQVELPSGEGSLVFCPTCGMHMQKDGAYCEKCGMQLQSNANNQYGNLPCNGSVPLWNTEREDYGYANMSDGDIEQINKFMSGGGISVPDDYDTSDNVGDVVPSEDGYAGMDSISAASEIDAITAQFANMYQPQSNTEMPAIGGASKHMGEEVRKVENFAMESSYVDDEYVDEGRLPVIEGASMEFDPNEPEPEDPNAFVMTEEAIEDILPQYTEEPAAAEEIPTYEEPVYEPAVAEELPTYEEPVYEPAVAEELPTYEEPAYEPVAAEEIPTYEEPVYEPAVAEELPTYEEPAYEPVAAEEIPTYEEPAYEPVAAEEIPTYEEPAYEPVAAEEIPTYEEPVYEPAAAEELPTYEEPAYEPVAAEEIPTYEEPAYEPVAAEEIPTYEEPAYEPVAAEEIPAYEETSEEDAAAFAIPVYSEDGAVSEESYSYSDNAQSDYSSDIPLYEEETPAPAPIPEPESDKTQILPLMTEDTYSPPVYTQPENESGSYDSVAAVPSVGAGLAAVGAKASDVPPPPEEVDLGRLIYCRNCGQDMYEKELVCKNCGAPKREEYKRPTFKDVKKKESKKLFGFLSIPALIGIVLVIGLAVVLVVPSLLGGDKVPVSSGSGGTSPIVTDSGSSSDSDSGTESVQTTTTGATENTTSEPADTTTSKPVESNTEKPSTTTEKPVESTVPTDDTKPVTTTPKPVTTTPKPVTTTPKPATTTPKPVVTTTPYVQPSYVPSAAIKAQNKQRDKIIAAFETISGEVGKVDALARNTIYAMEIGGRTGKSYYASGLGAALLKEVKSGKATVTSAVNAAKPTDSSLNSAYRALCKLQDKYLDYYNYVTNPGSYDKYQSKCDNYINSFNSYAASSFDITVLNTSSQTATDRNQYYADVLGNAVVAMENAASAYSTLRTKAGSLSESSFSGKFATTLENNISTYVKAVKYTQIVETYAKILSGAPSAYSAAYSNVKSAAGVLYDAAETFVLAPYDNTLSNFKSTVGNYVNSVTSAASKAKAYL